MGRVFGVMLKCRVIPVLLWDEHGCVKGQGFNPGRRIGSMADRLRLLERRDIDELIILDISGAEPRFDELRELCKNMFCPITYGGGIRNTGHIRSALACGADKVAINSMAIERPGFIREASERFGAQAIVVGINFRPGDDTLGRSIQMEHCGAGEILLTDVERDGTMRGYNLDLISAVSRAVSIPVIACGGCGSYEDMEAAMRAGAHAVAAGAMFQFRELTPKGASRYLNEHGIPART